jgi:hypothetical protein
MSREFEVRREVELPGTPEQVWDAVATGNGVAGWMFPTAEGAPSAVGEEWAGHVVTALDAPHHFAVRAENEGWFNSLDYRIERTPAGALLRYVHSGVLSDDWEGQYDGINRATSFYLHSLGEYLAHFSGRTVVYVGVKGPDGPFDPAAFDALRAAIGAGPGSAVGDRVAVTVPGLDPIDAEIDYLEGTFVGLRSGDALYRFYGQYNPETAVFAGHHLFAEGADREREEQAWTAWLAQVAVPVGG